MTKLLTYRRADGGNKQGEDVVVGYETVQNALETADNYEQFMGELKKYHPHGHNLVGWHCRTNPDMGETGWPLHMSLMGLDVMSARDPIFYRWHGHLE